jgi:hypothetical protein
MPSDYERRRLEEIEAVLRVSDPGLDRALRMFRPRRPRALAWLIVGWLVTAGVALIGWWIAAFILLGPLLAVTVLALSKTLGVGGGSPSATINDGRHPPTWTRFWG